MNYYSRHIGDWMRDTAHLSEVEECIYSRMIDQYYSREKPLPCDQAMVCRLVRAASKEARKAVGVILAEFFVLEVDGWHQKRCDAELQRFAEKSAKAAKSAAARWGKSHSDDDANAYANAMEAQCEGIATHHPRPSSQEERGGIAPASPAGLACKAMREAGIAAVNPSHPDLLALVEQGVEPQAFADMAIEVFERHGPKPMAYVLTALKNRLANPPAAPIPLNTRRSTRDDERRAVIDGLTGRTGQPAERDITADSAALG